MSTGDGGTPDASPYVQARVGAAGALGLTALLAAQLPAMTGPAALFGYYGLYVWFVGRLQHVISRAAVRRRHEQVSGGVLLLLGVRMAVES